MIIVRIWEGLGNQMFQYAYARALYEKGIGVRLDLAKSYDDSFEKYRNHTQRSNSIQNFKIRLKEIDVHSYGKYSYMERKNVFQKLKFFCAENGLWKYGFYEEKQLGDSLAGVKLKKDCYVKGWFQNEAFFREIRDILLKEFVPRNKIKISTEIKEALASKESVSVHIRRGDYVKISTALGMQYYYKAIEWIKNKYENPVFLVFSDDIMWVKQNLNIEANCIYVNENRKLQDYEELFIMSRCKSNIISNSTFSWWAAWLNVNDKKYVIAPRKWFKGQEVLMLDEWICI